MDFTLENVKKLIESNQGFHSTLKMRLIAYDADAGRLTVRLPYRDAYARIPDIGDYHGGVLASVLDVVGTFACMLKCKAMTPTMNLRTDFLKAPVKCDLIVTANVLRSGRKVAVADISATDDVGTLYAVGRGSWSVIRSE